MCAPAALRRGGGSGNDGAGDVSARARAGALQGGLCATVARPADGRYGENPNRLFKHMQWQVILKPAPADVQEVYLSELRETRNHAAPSRHEVRGGQLGSPTLSAWGVGWQVMLDGLEITQFTYFQQCGGVDLFPISAELTYGLERIAAFLQDVDSIYDIVWARDPESGNVVRYGDVRLADELQFSVYNFELGLRGESLETFRAVRI